MLPSRSKMRTRDVIGVWFEAAASSMAAIVVLMDSDDLDAAHSAEEGY